MSILNHEMFLNVRKHTDLAKISLLLLYRKVGNKRMVANCQMLIMNLCMESMPSRSRVNVVSCRAGSRYFLLSTNGELHGRPDRSALQAFRKRDLQKFQGSSCLWFL